MIKINESQALTMCKFKSGRSGIRAAVSRSFSCPYPDRESHANRFKTYTHRCMQA